MHPAVKTVVDHMNANLHRKLTPKDLAQLAGLSRSRLCYVFKEEMGMAVERYLKALRIKKAHELLETTSLRVKEIGAAVGMRDQSHFSRDFKRVYNLTPSQNRERLSSSDRKE